MHRAARWGVATIALFATAMLSGCDYSGGGWYGGSSPRNALVTFAMSCQTTDAQGRDGGQGTFTDRAANVRFVASATGCGGIGTYQPVDRTLTGGSISIGFVDTGAVGPSKGDHLHVTLYGGSYSGYDFDQDLSGGNLNNLTR